MAYSVAEDELRGMDTSALVGHLAAWNYFQSVEAANNKKFVQAFKAYAKKANLPGGDKRVTDDPMEAAYFGVYVWKQAVEKAKSFDVDPVRKAVYGQTFAARSGRHHARPDARSEVGAVPERAPGRQRVRAHARGQDRARGRRNEGYARRAGRDRHRRRLRARAPRHGAAHRPEGSAGRSPAPARHQAVSRRRRDPGAARRSGSRRSPRRRGQARQSSRGRRGARRRGGAQERIRPP